MAHDFSNWLRRLLLHGESVQTEPPRFTASDRSEVRELLHQVFVAASLDLAGPSLPFDESVAVAATECLARACWELVSGEDSGKQTSLQLTANPTSPADHLSADLTLRFLPAVYRRAKSRAADSVLVHDIEAVLRAWPLSGVLADLDGTPNAPLDFFGHSGLQLLFAERLVRTARPGWTPTDGTAREWAERVFSERNLSLPVLSPKEESRE